MLRPEEEQVPEDKSSRTERRPIIKAPPEWGPEPVPREVRTLGVFDFFVLWASLGVGLLVLVAGSLLTSTDFGLGLSLTEALLVIVLGSIIGSLMLSSAGVIGSRYGTPTMVSLRPIVGVKGSYIPTAMNILQLVGWTSFEIMVMGEAAATITGGGQGSIENYVWVLAFGLICFLLAIGGPLVVVRHWLEKIAIWLVLGSTIWITYQILVGQDLFAQAGGFSSDITTLLLGLDLVIAMPISWWPLISDYNRFASKESSGFIGTSLGYILSNTWFYFLGAAIVVVLAKTDVIGAIFALGFGMIALVLILVDETDNAFADIYSTAVSCQNIFPKVKQRIYVIGATVIGVIVAMVLTYWGGLSGAAALSYEGFLLLIGGFFVPLLGVLFSDYFLVRKGKYRLEEFYKGARAVRLSALVSWLIGLVAFFSITYLGIPTGASLPSFGLAAVIHFLICKSGLTD